MTENPVFEANIAALRSRDPVLADEIQKAIDADDPSAFRYSAAQRARNGSLVPLFRDGASAHSLFNPEREAAQLIDTMAETGFALFAGIGGAFHIREFLSRDSGRACLAAESSPMALASLFGLIDLSDVIADLRVTVIALRAGGEAGAILSRRYLPALHGNFRLVPLRSWQERNGGRMLVARGRRSGIPRSDQRGLLGSGAFRETLAEEFCGEPRARVKISGKPSCGRSE